MKIFTKLYPFLALVLLLMACNEHEIPNEFNIVGNWDISKTFNTGTTKTGAEIGFIDSYTFNSDGTFARIWLGGESERNASGVYTISPVPESEPSSHLYWVALTYHTGLEMASNCYGGTEPEGTRREGLVVMEDHSLSTTSHACDGPANLYVKR